MPSYCLVPCCTASSNTVNNKRIFHVLPSDTALCAKWLDAIGLNNYADNLKKKKGSYAYRVCSDHFDESSYETKRALIRTAVPTLKLKLSDKNVNNDKSDDTNAQTNSSPDNKASDAIEIDEHALRVEINRRLEIEASMLAAGPSNSEEFLKYSRKFLSPKTLKLLTCQLLMEKDDKRKNLVKHKFIYLDLYYHNPRAYGFLQQFMSLPPINSLRKFYLNVNSGLVSPRCLRVLRSMVSQMNAKEKCCVVGMASTSVRKHVYYDVKNDAFRGLQQVDKNQWKDPVKKAYVLVVRGLFSSWQIPVAYALAHDNKDVLHYWTDSVIRNLIQEGLDVCAFISNQSDTDSKQLSELRHITSTSNSFVLMNKTIYNVFDLRFLIQSLRDSLMRFQMSIAFEGVASWEHILAFYNIELAHLTHDCGNIDGSQESSTDHALLLFSKRVAAPMRAFLNMKLLDGSAFATVNLISRVSELCDSLKLSTLKHDSPNRGAFTGEESQKKILEEMLDYLNGFRKVSNGVRLNEKIEPVEGLMVTLQSVLDLWKYLRRKGGTHLLTQLLNLEFVEDCFREIAAHNKKRNNKYDQVTTIEFMRGFNKSFLDSFIKNARHNSSHKMKSSLSKLHEYLADTSTEKDNYQDLEIKNRALPTDNLDHKLKLPKQKVVRFIAAYLMTKALEKHGTCATLKRYLIPSKKTTSTFIECEYFEVKLPVEFVIFVVKMEHEFVKMFEEELMPQEVAAQAMKALNKLVILPCCCFPLFLVKKLFIRLRIYNAVKDINRQIKTNDTFKINTIDL